MPAAWERAVVKLVKPTGFREYDARWLLGSEINLMGVEALGMGLGTLILRLHTAVHCVSPLAAVRAAIKSAAHLREMTNAGKNFCCTGG